MTNDKQTSSLKIFKILLLLKNTTSNKLPLYLAEILCRGFSWNVSTADIETTW